MLHQNVFNRFPAIMVVILATVMVASSAVTSFAEFVYLDGDNALGESWETAIDWSDDTAPCSGNEYHVGWDGTNYMARLVRSPNATSGTFGGDSLTIHAGSTFLLKGNPGDTATINDLRMNGGQINTFCQGTTTVAGTTFTVNSDSKIDINSAADGCIAISSLLAGSGDLRFDGTRSGHVLKLAHSSNTYKGDWTVVKGKLWASASGSLGSGDITVNTNGDIDVDYDHYSTGATFTLDGLMTLDTGEDHTFGEITIGGTPLSAGTYSFSYLNDNFDANFVDGGNGTLTVIPEPGTLALLALGALSLLLWRWRRRR